MVQKKFKYLFQLDLSERHALRTKETRPYILEDIGPDRFPNREEEDTRHIPGGEDTTGRSKIIRLTNEQATALGWPSSVGNSDPHESTESVCSLVTADFDDLGHDQIGNGS